MEEIKIQGALIHNLKNINLEQLIPDKTTLLLEVYESLQVTASFVRILKNKYGIVTKAIRSAGCQWQFCDCHRTQCRGLKEL